ncbi:hypothetical protein FKW77_000290 [Venturia effusa]|uniref:Peptidase A1 domain-containing protein n=1 Tax=Venturia effusa TaxID=50376 RepID=A0A517LKS1_9PEZI|nr:hypothetical protein FKW77_000290 [Venturia effusa]
MAFALSLLSLALLLSVHYTKAAALLPLEHRTIQLIPVPVTAFQAPSADVVTDNFVPLTKLSSTSSSPSTLEAVRKGLSPSDLNRFSEDPPANGSAPLVSIHGVAYLINITFGTQDVQLTLDTGSSDTWLIRNGFKCTDPYGRSRSTGSCRFGPVYNGNITQIPNENLQTLYGDGSFVIGVVGTQDITIAGIKVQNQTLSTLAYWNGDGVSSGILGLAYPAMTSIFSGVDPSKDNSGNRVPYDPIFTTMYKRSLSAPTFSLAIQRDSSGVGGYVAFGGLPAAVTTNGSFASTPIQILTSLRPTANTFYTITPDALVYRGAAARNPSQYIVDSGSSLTYVPTDVAKSVADLFSPKATFDDSQGAYFVSCNATAPSFGVKIGGTIFNLDPQDLILQLQQNPTTGECLLGVTDGGRGPYTLGVTFLNNVIAVFDVGAAQMRFAAHSY